MVHAAEGQGKHHRSLEGTLQPAQHRPKVFIEGIELKEIDLLHVSGERYTCLCFPRKKRLRVVSVKPASPSVACAPDI